MYCSKCGTQIAEGLDYCLYCGEKIDKNTKPTIPPKTNNETIHNSKIRKGIKAYAKSINKENLIVAIIICSIISIIMTVITSSYSIETIEYIDGVDVESTTQNVPIWLTLINMIIFFIIGIVSTFGISKAALNLSRKQNITLKDIFIKPFNNIKNIILYYVFIVLIIFTIIIIAFIPIINILLFLSLFILLIYFIPFFDILRIMCVDDEKNETFFEMIKEALKIVKGHRVEYYAMLLSFIGWFILCILTLGILYFYTLPYLRLSVVNMYRMWNGEETFNVEKQGISNIGIIILTLVIYIILTLSIITLIILGYKSTEIEPRIDNITNDVFDDRKNVTITLKDVTIKVPQGYKSIMENSKYNYYFEKDDKILTYNLNQYTSKEEEYKQEIKMEKNSRLSDYTYEDKEFTKIVNEKEVNALLVKETNTIGTTTYKLLAIYPINDSSSITVTLSSYKTEITENDLTQILDIK